MEKHIKSYTDYIKEIASTETEDTDDIVKDNDPETYKDILDELKNMINKTIESGGGEYKTFINSYLKEPETYKIEGLINESDIYAFYLKFRNPIDQVLNKSEFYSKPPVDLNVSGLYDYIIKGTLKAVDEFIEMLSK